MCSKYFGPCLQSMSMIMMKQILCESMAMTGCSTGAFGARTLNDNKELCNPAVVITKLFEFILLSELAMQFLV